MKEKYRDIVIGVHELEKGYKVKDIKGENKKELVKYGYCVYKTVDDGVTDCPSDIMLDIEKMVYGDGSIRGNN